MATRLVTAKVKFNPGVSVTIDFYNQQINILINFKIYNETNIQVNLNI